ncbi:ferritin-like protein [Aeromicrobium marinum DSM 15272]|uniref:Ferritin-like protein n=1 Tax=Aeromicrobium marinum DSM 15272 TaxID=585531 RepID=E2S910_9ACTN|nr:DNA starvation/stationary phase protection protein [Aeromicrobium marinum]EFQ84280.1 ferritin-like protein [Aeromicrobium marinum DSM 15272]
MTTSPRFTVPGLSQAEGEKVAGILQERLHALNDLALTLKHVHWNVVGPHFIAVHEMIDPQVEEVRGFVDETAERIATLGSPPLGTPGSIVAGRSWDDYSIARGTTNEHLGALEMVYTQLIGDHRKAQAATADLDPITEDLLIAQISSLELFQWFIRAHLESTTGGLSTDGAESEQAAADAAGEAADVTD